VIRRAVVLGLILLMVVPVAAAGLTVNDVAREVRCPTCNTPLNVSNAPVALRMKSYIADRIEAGWSEQRIIDGLVDEFGPQILATPPKSGFDLIAWLVPALAVGLGLAAIPLIARTWTRRAPPVAAPDISITDEERRRLDEELGPPG
jgi:cytochrome c-type biogenesis protein CcmH